MPVTTVRWVSGKQFVGTDSRNHSVVLSQDKYCSVAATVRGVAEIVSEIEIVDTRNAIGDG